MRRFPLARVRSAERHVHCIVNRFCLQSFVMVSCERTPIQHAKLMQGGKCIAKYTAANQVGGNYGTDEVTLQERLSKEIAKFHPGAVYENHELDSVTSL